jgi:hypothetical protein
MSKVNPPELKRLMDKKMTSESRRWEAADAPGVQNSSDHPGLPPLDHPLSLLFSSFPLSLSLPP